MEQSDIWSEHTRDLVVSDVIYEYQNPAIFQIELSDLLKTFAGRFVSCIEVGCETGAVSFLLTDTFELTLLDYNEHALALAKASFARLGKNNLEFVKQDMFQMDFGSKKFDIVFNSGVIEHYDKTDRIRILKEYSKILSDGGRIIIGYPNHYSVPYRIAYLIRNFCGKWNYPKEYVLYDMKAEIDESGMLLESRSVLSKSSIFNWLNFCLPLRKFMILLDKVVHFEGYLTVVTIRKRIASV